MQSRNRKIIAFLAAFLLLAPALESVAAQQPAVQTIGITHAQEDGIIAGIAASGALIGITTYALLKHNHSVTGCARSGPDTLTLTSDSDKLTYSLIGDVAEIKSGDRVRVSGKKRHRKSATPEFLVEKVSRDFGACEVYSPTR